MPSDDAWTTVSRRRARAIGRADAARLARVAATTNLGAAARDAEAALGEDALASRVAMLVRQLSRAMEDVRGAVFVEKALDAVAEAVVARVGGRTVTVLALGLGSPATSAAARCQLAFADLMAARVREAPGVGAVRVRAYDPCFTMVDERVLTREGARETLSRERCDEYVNARASGEEEELVVFYMPHCEGHLYESVVCARWSASALRDFVCVGNTFETYAERWKSRNADPEKTRPSHVIAASTIVHAMVVDPGDTFAVPGAFNDTSVQTFDVNGDLPEVDDGSRG